MSFVSVAPDSASEATRTLAGIGSELSAASTAAAAPTTGVAAAAQDEVSTAIAGVFGNFGREFQALSAEAQAFHDQFVAKLAGGMGNYLSAEAANAQQILLDAVNAPANSLLGRPLAGSGATPAQYSARVFDYPTPLGPIQLTLYGEPSLPGPVTVTGGTLQVPTPFALALDALGPEANVLITLRNSSAAFTNAVQTGNPVAAAEALLETPANAASSFFFGQQTVTESYPVPSGTQYTSADISVPLGGLLTPLQPVTLTLHSSNGTVTSIPLDGTEFGGLIPAAEGLLSGS
ncbi:PE family protein [Mycobacterium sp. 852002-51057_SCH5723018]|uniref:PE family protein n=1 Tax=Mycobacterium sp. 852002-51057_SCH5723018 TaxID=1834094 RepID=UPI0007FDEF58|nr:PE family protein [Mycobacterium sp. 852002-51057_SCH5723018]OBG20901.1 hypothetical protein A5764_14745 [Mycobacterium sp. 852002-51057_SCH5723018]